jgi:hypothetical protein
MLTAISVGIIPSSRVADHSAHDRRPCGHYDFAWSCTDAFVAVLRFVHRKPALSAVILLLLVALQLKGTFGFGLYCVLYGGEDDECIRFTMDAALSEEEWLVQLENEKRTIEELPVVKGAVDFFYSDVSVNLNKVQATVWCCWAGSQFKRVMVACDEKENMQLVPPVSGVPLDVVQQEVRPRRAAAEQADANRIRQFTNPLRANPHAVTTAVHQQRALPPELLWEIPAGDEKRILEHCCP